MRSVDKGADLNEGENPDPPSPEEMFERFREIARKVVQSFHTPRAAGSPELATLTPREEEILALLAQGYVAKEIARKLFVSYATVRTHLHHIYEKLHVGTKTEAVVKYLR